MNKSKLAPVPTHRHHRSILFFVSIALVALGGCDSTSGPVVEEEPVGEWFDSPPNDEAILRKAFIDSVFIIDPESAVFSNVLKKNSQFGLRPSWCGFVRLKNRRGSYGMTTFHVTLLNEKPYLDSLEGSDLLDPGVSCRGTIFGDKQ